MQHHHDRKPSGRHRVLLRQRSKDGVHTCRGEVSYRRDGSINQYHSLGEFDIDLIIIGLLGVVTIVLLYRMKTDGEDGFAVGQCAIMLIIASSLIIWFSSNDPIQTDLISVLADAAIVTFVWLIFVALCYVVLKLLLGLIADIASSRKARKEKRNRAIQRQLMRQRSQRRRLPRSNP